MAQPSVFISYSHQDEALKDELLPHLGVVQQLGLLRTWDDRQIGVGEDWFDAISEQLAHCRVAILLVSEHFLSSRFCLQEEVPPLLERRRRDGMLVVPLLMRPCAWHRVAWLKAIQMLPRDGLAAMELKPTRRARMFVEVVDTVCDFLEALQKTPAAAPTDQAIAAAAQQASVQGDRNFVVQLIGDGNTLNLAPREAPASEWPPLAPEFVDLERLPETGFELIGREAELQRLDEAWASPSINVVALVAWGGFGKSTLVRKWCGYLAADNFRGAGRVFAWSFYSQGSSERVASADEFIDAALRFFEDPKPEAGSAWSKGERLAGLVRRAKGLLVLDGLEPLQDRYQVIKDPALARLIEELAADPPSEARGGLCVITTREPVKELADFPTSSQSVDLEQLSPEAGRALLRIKGVRGSDAELERASRNFGNHALAISLLANYLRAIPGRPIAAAATIPDLPEIPEQEGRQPRRVMAAFAKRFGDGPELELLCLLGLFDRPADAGCIAALRRPPAIEGLTEHLSGLSDADWLRLLSNLKTEGLLALVSGDVGKELDAHPLVRQHFGGWSKAQRPAAWRAGHARLFEHLQTIPLKDQPDTLQEMAPLLHAMHHGAAAGWYAEAYHGLYMPRISRWDDAYLWKSLGAFGADLTAVASLFSDSFAVPADGRLSRDLPWLQNQLALDLKAVGRFREAVPLLRLALDGSQGSYGSSKNAAACATSLAELFLVIGDVSSALATAREGSRHADYSGDAFWAVQARATLANVHFQAGERYLHLFREAEALQIKHRPDYPWLFSVSGCNQVESLIEAGILHETRERANYALKIAEEGCNPLSTALSTLELGRIATILDDTVAACELLDRAVYGLRAAGDITFVPRGLLARSAFFRVQRNFASARRDLAEVLRLAIRCEMKLFECDARIELARLALAERKRDEAQALYERAAELVADAGYHRRKRELTQLRAQLGPG